MKKILVIAAMTMGFVAMAQIPGRPNVSLSAIVNAARDTVSAPGVRVNVQPTSKIKQLEKEIAEQDAKRNRQIPGVAPETMEGINDRQDSICLALRSQLVDLKLTEGAQGTVVTSVAPVTDDRVNIKVDTKALPDDRK